ncbi:MAG: peptidoglycan editing factor PgeF [Aquificota bacterium]|nr:MAG: peptidoglycan editing factor PgeF [Aquificota bacterium]
MKKISLGKLNIVYTEKEDGNMRDIYSREKIIKRFGFNNIFVPVQKHTNVVVSIEEVSNKNADGIYTGKKNQPIGVLTADCMPVVLSDGEIVSVIHAGWRGLFNGILENGVKYLINKEKAFAFIGPSARDCCYQVGDDFVEEAKKYGISINKKYFKFDDGIKFSMQEVAKDRLKTAGINHIIDISLCTICKENFFSYRKGDFENRLLTFAWLSEV